MTRGKIIYIDGDYIYESTEFNGDMHPYSRGQDIVEKYQAGKINSSQDFTDIIIGFNRKYFNQGITSAQNKKNMIQFIHNFKRKQKIWMKINH